MEAVCFRPLRTNLQTWQRTLRLRTAAVNCRNMNIQVSMEIQVSFDNNLRPEFILDAFKRVSDIFTSDFKIRYIGRSEDDPSSKMFLLSSTDAADFYRAGLVGANIELQIQRYEAAAGG